MDELSLRHADKSDLPWIVGLIPRLHEFGPPEWRDVTLMERAQIGDIARTVRGARRGGAVLIAESENRRLGLVHFKFLADPLTDEAILHIAHLAVSRVAEGRGIARRLLLAAEDEGRRSGCRLMTLNVFVDNARPQLIYEHLGFKLESLRMVKIL